MRRWVVVAVGLVSVWACVGSLRAESGADPGAAVRVPSFRSTPRTSEEEACLRRLRAKAEEDRVLWATLAAEGPEARERELLRQAVGEPPPGLPERERQLFELRRHIGVLQDVLVWAAAPSSYPGTRFVLLGRLEACGYTLPVRVEPHPFVLMLSAEVLSELKRSSVRGNVAAAVVLAGEYEARSWWLHGVPGRSGNHPLAVLGSLPGRLGADARAGAYVRRARKWSERRLGELRRQVARLEGGR